MKRKLATAILLLLTLTSSAFAGEWILERNGQKTRINFSRSGDCFVGTYLEPRNNDSQFTGYFHQGKHQKLMTLVQKDGNDFFVVHAGRQTSRGFRGSWYSVSGNEGQFYMYQVK